MATLSERLQHAADAWASSQTGDTIAVIAGATWDPPSIIDRLARDRLLTIDRRVIWRSPRGLWDELLHDGRHLTAVLLIGADSIEDARHA